MSAPTSRKITITEAAETYGVPRRSIARAAERGQIPSERIGNMFVLDAEGVRLYAEVHNARRKLDEYTAGTGDDTAEVAEASA